MLTGLAPPRRPLGADTYERIACADGPRSYQFRGPAQLASPLARRPYDFRHAGVSWRLNSGVPAPLVAEWAGHTVEVLLRIYAHCIEGDDERWFGPMEDELGRG